MARFECSRCGRCCLNFGRYIIIERQFEGGRFSCHSRLSGEHFVAQLVETGADDSLDLKGFNKGTPVDVDTDPELYRKLV